MVLATAAIQGVIVARWLGPNLYGTAALVMTYPALVLTFLEPRSSQATVKYLGEFDSHDQRDKAIAVCHLGFAVDLAISVTATLAVIVTASWAAGEIVGSSGTVPLIVGYSLGYVLRSPSGTSHAILTSAGRFTTLSLVRSAVALTRAGLILGLVAAGFGVSGVVWGSAVGLALDGLILGAIAYRFAIGRWGRSSLSSSWAGLRGKRREIGRFLLWNDLGSLLGMVPKQVDIVLLGYLRGPTEVGYYRLAKSLSSLAGSVATPLQSVVYPRISAAWARERESVLPKIKSYAVRVGLPLGAAALLSVIVVGPVIQLIAGREYLPSVVPAQLLIAGAAVWMAFFWLRPVYMTLGRVRFWASLLGGASVLCLIGYLALAPRLGATGIALTNLLILGIAVHAIAGYRLWRHRLILSRPGAKPQHQVIESSIVANEHTIGD